MDDQRPLRRDDVLPSTYRDCFGCGDDNPGGLHLRDIRRDGEVVRAVLQARPDLQGFPGVLHGGIAATALDELMGYACKMLRDCWAVTAKMELRYRRPIADTQVLVVEAGLREGAGRRLRLWGRIVNEAGDVAVDADALFVPSPSALA